MKPLDCILDYLLSIKYCGQLQPRPQFVTLGSGFSGGNL